MRFSWQTIIRAEDPAQGQDPLRVLVVSVDCTDEASRTPMLAPAFLVAHARRDPLVRRRVDFHIRQFSAQEPVEVMIEEILGVGAAVIGFSCYVWNYTVLEQMIPILKRLRPETLIVLGGPQVLNQEHEVFAAMPDVDLLVYRDGEPAFADLVRQLAEGTRDWTAVGGALVRTPGGVVDTLAAKRTLKFAEVASPYLDGIITGRHDNLFMETYRGCPYSCAFCAWGGDEGPMNDLLPLERVKAELEVMRGMGAFTLGFFDSNFNQPPSRSESIFDAILAAEEFKVVGLSVFAQTLKESLAAKLATRATFIGVGLQSSDVAVNALMTRHFVNEKMVAGLNLLQKHRINYVMQVIVGLPGDTYQSIVSTLRYALEFEPPTLDAFRLMVLPGTEYRRRAGELGLVYEQRPYHYVISHNTMSVSEINRAERMAQALSLFYNLASTRREMFRLARDHRESVVDLCEALGTFIESFALFDRAELRKGDIIRTKDEAYLLKILQDFAKFRHDLGREMARRQLLEELTPAGNEYSYLPVRGRR